MSLEVGGVLVMVPTFNERDTVGEVLRRLLRSAPGAHTLVIDDGSSDGTAEIVAQLARDHPEVSMLEREQKLGLGTAYLTGFRWGLERGYTTLVEMDADLSHDPADVPRLTEALGDADLVLGSRYVPGGDVKNWGRWRRILSTGGNRYARTVLGFEVMDSTSGFRAYRADILRGLDLDTVRSEGYGFQIEMVRRVHLVGGRIKEVPITFVERAAGRSKMSHAIVLEALYKVARWGVRDRLVHRARRARSRSEQHL
jgi:dolichol-phosphate mannosyltransferase